MIRYVLVAILSLSLMSCGEKDKSPKLAVVNGKNITQTQFDAYLKFKRVPNTDTKKTDRLLDQYIERAALAGVIEKEDVLDTDLIQAELNEFRKEMLISRYFEKYLKEKVSEQAVQNFYNTHTGDYEQKKVHAAHILIRTNRKMSEPERKAKLTTAQEAYSQIKAGKVFEEAAKEYSEDKVSAKKGGDLGWIKEGGIDPKFSETLFALQPGDISEPFETPFGFHVVKLIEGPKVVKRPFSEVAGDIRYQLRNEAKQVEIERLKGKAEIEMRD